MPLPPQDPRSPVWAGVQPDPMPPPPSGAVPPPPARPGGQKLDRSWWQKKRYSIPLGLFVLASIGSAIEEPAPGDEVIVIEAAGEATTIPPLAEQAQEHVETSTTAAEAIEPEPTKAPKPSTTTTTTTTTAPAELTDEQIIEVLGPHIVRQTLIDAGVTKQVANGFSDASVVAIADEACAVAVDSNDVDTKLLLLYSVVQTNTSQQLTPEDAISVAGATLGVYCQDALGEMQDDNIPTATTSPPPPPATTTTRPPSPEILIECPRASSENAPYRAEFDLTVLELTDFRSATISYGDGKSYRSTTLEDAQQNMFWHKYQAGGEYTVSLAVTDAYGQGASAKCSFSWEAKQPAPSSPSCDPNYTGCVPIDSDVDCAGGSGNGPSYVWGPVTVIGRDIYGLDRDNDGIGCE